MKPEEAILMMRNRIDTASEIAGKGTDGKAFEDMEMAISALKELQQYREIGTVEECREAVEKQKPKEIYHQKWNGIDGVPYDLCPTCENNLCTTGVFARNKMNYCEKCGQKLCWNEDMEDERD